MALGPHVFDESIPTDEAWAIRMFNDDVTPMDFVVRCLVDEAGLKQRDAVQIMLQVHTRGSVRFGRMRRDEADAMRHRIQERVRTDRQSFRCDLEPLGSDIRVDDATPGIIHQLVLQFAAQTTEDFERGIALENRLIDLLAKEAEVDGHDFGSMEMNIFIHTKKPQICFERCLPVIHESGMSLQGAGSRPLDVESNYNRIWPADSSAPFVVA